MPTKYSGCAEKKPCACATGRSRRDHDEMPGRSCPDEAAPTTAKEAVGRAGRCRVVAVLGGGRDLARIEVARLHPLRHHEELLEAHLPRSGEIRRDQARSSEGPVPRRRLRGRGRGNASQGRMGSRAHVDQHVVAPRCLEPQVRVRRRDLAPPATRARLARERERPSSMLSEEGARASGPRGKGHPRPPPPAAAAGSPLRPRRARSLAPRRPCGRGCCLPVPLSASSPTRRGRQSIIGTPSTVSGAA